MSKELEALEKIKKCLFWSDEGLNDIAIIEAALKENEQYKAIEEELGLPLKVWVYLAKKELNKDFSKVYIENTIDDERQRQRFMSVNGRPQRHIICIDFDKKLFQLQGTSNEWCNKVPFSDYGKTIALTKEELE